MAWVDVGPAQDLPPGTRRTLLVAGKAVTVFNVEGRYYAIDDTCSHEAQSLSNGILHGCEIVCPRHGARFSLETGAALSPPAWEPIDTYETRVVDGVVQVATPPGT